MGTECLGELLEHLNRSMNPPLLKKNWIEGNEIKARATLLMALPNKDQLKFHSYQDEKLLKEAIEKSTNNTNNTNKADDTAHGVSTTHTQGTDNAKIVRKRSKLDKHRHGNG
ncbi:hypothetical protein Tco_0491696 [Tanacetum coccineum]